METKDLVDIFIKNDKVIHFNKKTSDDHLYPYLYYCLKSAILDKDYLFMELGVFTGNTFNAIRSHIPEDIKLYGFDTFTGLPEDWMINDTDKLYDKGTFSMDYIHDNTYNTEFIAGRVEDTLEKFIEKNNKKISFIHFDMDLYNPTFFSLNTLYNNFVDGTILVFDDFYNLPGWENHSFKALLNLINLYDMKFEPLSTVGWIDGWASAAIRIIR
jgi:hypothetical protein